MPSRPIGRLFRKNSGFSEILTRTLGTITFTGRGGVICRPVIAERRLSGARHLVGLTVEGWHSQTTYPLRLGTFSTFGPSHFGPRLLVNSDLDHWSIRTFFYWSIRTSKIKILLSIRTFSVGQFGHSVGYFFDFREL